MTTKVWEIQNPISIRNWSDIKVKYYILLELLSKQSSKQNLKNSYAIFGAVKENSDEILQLNEGNFYYLI